MHAEIRQFVKWAKKRGWERQRQLDGRQHYVLKRNGQIMRIPGTPSDWRSMKNCRSQLLAKERITS